MLLKRIISIWKNYLVGQFLITLFVFLITWGMGALTGLRFPLGNAIAAAVCEAVPNIGPIISGVISGILALVFGSSRLEMANWQFLIVIVVCVILIQLLQNWLISPLIIGKKMDLHPLAVIIGMTVFSILFGFWGMILAVPIMGSLREIWREYNPPAEKKAKQEDVLQQLPDGNRFTSEYQPGSHPVSDSRPEK